MSNPTKFEETGLGFIWKALALCSFIMLSMLTWATNPLVKLVEKVQEKQTIRAELKVCRHVIAMQAAYDNYLQAMFASGCMWETKNVLTTLNPKQAEYIEELFQITTLLI